MNSNAFQSSVRDTVLCKMSHLIKTWSCGKKNNLNRCVCWGTLKRQGFMHLVQRLKAFSSLPSPLVSTDHLSSLWRSLRRQVKGRSAEEENGVQRSKGQPHLSAYQPIRWCPVRRRRGGREMGGGEGEEEGKSKETRRVGGLQGGSPGSITPEKEVL